MVTSENVSGLPEASNHPNYAEMSEKDLLERYIEKYKRVVAAVGLLNDESYRSDIALALDNADKSFKLGMADSDKVRTYYYAKALAELDEVDKVN